MWVWIIVAVVVVAAAVFAFWPRHRGVEDGRVIGSRRTTHGGIESAHPTSQRNWPAGG